MNRIPTCAIQDCDEFAITTLPVHITGLTVTLVKSGRADKNIPVCQPHRTALYHSEGLYLNTKENNVMSTNDIGCECEIDWNCPLHQGQYTALEIQNDAASEQDPYDDYMEARLFHLGYASEEEMTADIINTNNKENTMPTTSKIKCANIEAHGNTPVYHDSIDLVKACYLGTVVVTPAEQITPTITIKEDTMSIIPITTTGPICGNTKVHGKDKVRHASPAMVKACYGVKSRSNYIADQMEKGSNVRPIANPYAKGEDVKCHTCTDGTVVIGPITNGIPASVRKCNCCAGKGYMTPADVKRDTYYHNMNDGSDS